MTAIKRDQDVFFRVVKRSGRSGKFVSRAQHGSTGQHVISVNRGTYKKGLKAASKVLRELNPPEKAD
ncbi:hypothetical protein SAMN04488037_104292 [Shimia marina]|uniref:Uncharacterized protein n=1 Tax=Shimia marina TaxID=321267 RepID=A0A0P1EUW3_9RHOB|nr:hypothetical protein SHM7688_03884 [Shimia marina]SFE03114.1 hypothetical protein SAMN04488037_104292 [Shimia marina]